jgi:hypothetical protein
MRLALEKSSFLVCELTTAMHRAPAAAAASTPATLSSSTTQFLLVTPNVSIALSYTAGEGFAATTPQPH